jgi:hypothetical protein
MFNLRYARVAPNAGTESGELLTLLVSDEV